MDGTSERTHYLQYAARGVKMKYLDLVELITEKEEYANYGVHKGMFGAIMSEEKIEDRWQVIFSEFYTGKDIADLLVPESDLLVHDFVPAEKYPPKH